MKWYKNPDYINISIQCDRLIEKGDRDELLSMVDFCYESGNNLDVNDMIRANYYYCSFNCLSRYQQLTQDESDKIQEKELLLCRKAMMILSEFKKKIMDADERAYFRAIYYSVVTNYASFLDRIGRIIPAIQYFEKISQSGFGMVQGNLGQTLIRFSFMINDRSQGRYIGRIGQRWLDRAVNSYDGNIYGDAKNSFQKWLGLVGKYKLSDSTIEGNERKMSNEEVNYREWFAEGGLALNPLNDCNYTSKVAYDPLYIQMIMPIPKKSSGFEVPELFSLFNNIKQEFVSARFQIYKAISSEGVHYSDEEVYLGNGLDGTLYGWSIEQAKMAFKSVYSIFDRIGFFLNEYLKLNMNERQISFKSIWRKIPDEMVEQSYALKGLKWIHKDLHNKAKVKEFEECIDPMMKEIQNVRNYMEHRFVRIVDDFLASSKPKSDSLSMEITLSDFRNQTVYLLKKCREAIILLSILVSEKERKNEKKQDETDVASMEIRNTDGFFKDPDLSISNEQTKNLGPYDK